MNTIEVTDSQLLHAVKAGRRDAMAAIVERQVDFVYAAALRQVRDAHLAEDVTQAVFVILWTKARAISSDVVLPAWLFNTTRYAAANAIRMRARRARHEREAAKVRNTLQSDAPANEVGEILDGAISTLRERDRSAVLLSYFAGKSWSEVGAAMGISAEAARKRGDRAIDKLRDYFSRRGIAMSSASLALDARGASAPASLVQSIHTSCNVAMLASSASATASGNIARAVIRMMTLAKIKLAGAIAAAMLVTVGVAGAVAVSLEPAPAQQQNAASAEPFTAKLSENVIVKIMALTQRDGENRSYWNADGSPTDVRFDDSDSVDEPPHTHQLLFKVEGLEPGDGCTWRFANAKNWSAVPAMHSGVAIDDGSQVITFRPADGATTTDLRVAVASGPYRVAATKKDLDQWTREGAESGEVVISPCVELLGTAGVAYTESFDNAQRRLVAIDVNGTEHLPIARSGERSASLNLEIVHFDLPLEQIDRIEFQARQFDKVVTIKDISLLPGKLTHPIANIGPATAPVSSEKR